MEVHHPDYPPADPNYPPPEGRSAADGSPSSRQSLPDPEKAPAGWGFQEPFARFAWAVLAYTLLVILFGAWVRISGSGDGCGENWPTCHGQLIPRSDQTKTLIEYGHRISSGLLGPMVIALVWWAHRARRRLPAARPFALLTLLFILIEAGIGAVLVRRGLVADDDSVARAVVIALHLANTLLLTAVTALTAWFGSGRRWPGVLLNARPLAPRQPPRHVARWLLVALVMLVLVSATGAVTALGDTLFPVSPTEGAGLFSRLKQELDVGAHFLVRLRVIHPILAVLVGLGLGFGSQRLFRQPAETRGLAQGVFWVTWMQLAIGALNVALGAPAWMQLVHLFVSQLLWVLLVLLFFSHQEDHSERTLQGNSAAKASLQGKST